MRNLLYYAALALLLPLSGCDSNSDGDDGPRFNDGNTGVNLDVSGALNASYSGEATFSIVQGTGASFSFILDDEHGSITLVRLGEPLATGQFPISSDNSIANRFAIFAQLNELSEDAGELSAISVTAGTVNITSANNERIAGSFTATGETSPGGEPVSMQAEFVARCLLLCG